MAQPEIIYHVFQRSFFDSNGDGQGDLPGMQQKLDYLQDLGVTSILLMPLYPSAFYHNYFAKDFEKIDPNYGTMGEYLALVKEVHRRGMKIYQDVEMQYVTHEHLWFKDSYNNPGSRYGKYVFYLDSLNQKPFWFYNVPEFTLYNNSKQKIAVVNMNNLDVRKYTFDLLNSWVDPNNDGKFDDGVDGFRLDHMMDDLDNAKKISGLFKNFWTPILSDLKKTNPAVNIIAEQANWFSLGCEYFREAGVDRVFAFYLKWAIETLDKKNLITAADSTLRKNPDHKQQIVFIENHDMRRYASVGNVNPAKLKVAAALNLLLGEVSLIYYGQELGMKGKPLKGTTDGNDIPVREAFEWYRKREGKGMAFWYRNTGVWWDSTGVQSNDGISVEEEKNDPNSLLNFYKKMIRLRKGNVALSEGKYLPAQNDNDQVFSFVRFTPDKRVIVLVNLSPKAQRAMVKVPFREEIKSWSSLMSTGNGKITDHAFSVNLPAYDVQVLELK